MRTLATKTDRAPVAGTVVLRSSRPVLTHSHPGRALVKFATRMLIRAAVVGGTRTTILAPLKTLAATAAKAQPIIVIHRGSNRLYLYNGIRFVRVFPVATGQAVWPTPLGRFQIVVKQVNPWWYPPTQDAWAAGAKPVPPGPGNPLGTRWMGLSAPGVGIHGTSEPWSIGHSESHGCIRMQIPAAEWLYTRVQIGTPVFIIPACRGRAGPAEARGAGARGGGGRSARDAARVEPHASDAAAEGRSAGAGVLAASA